MTPFTNQLEVVSEDKFGEAHKLDFEPNASTTIVLIDDPNNKKIRSL